jgi:hypothetical protein
MHGQARLHHTLVHQYNLMLPCGGVGCSQVGDSLGPHRKEQATERIHGAQTPHIVLICMNVRTCGSSMASLETLARRVQCCSDHLPNCICNCNCTTGNKAVCCVQVDYPQVGCVLSQWYCSDEHSPDWCTLQCTSDIISPKYLPGT